MENIDSSSNPSLQTAIPDLLKLLVDEDLVIVQQASILMAEMSRVPVIRDNLIETDDACMTITTCLNTTADYYTVHNLLLALFEISKNFESGIIKITKCGALIPLTKILDAPLESLVSIALSTIHNCLVSKKEIPKETIFQKSIFYSLFNLFNKPHSPSLITIATDCLLILTFNNQQSKDWIYEIGGIQTILSYFVNSKSISDKLENLLLKFLVSVSTSQKSKILMTDCLFLRQINQIISSGSKNGLICISLIKNLSDKLIFVSYNHEFIPSFLNLYKENSVSLKRKADILLILSNLTCNNEENKNILIESNLVEILIKNLEIEDLTLASLYVLKNLSTGCSLKSKVHAQIKNFGLEILNKLIINRTHTKDVLAFVKILTKLMSMTDEIRDCGLLINMLNLLPNLSRDFECLNLCGQSLKNLTKNSTKNLEIMKKSIHLFEEISKSENSEVKKLGLDLYYSTIYASI